MPVYDENGIPKNFPYFNQGAGLFNYNNIASGHDPAWSYTDVPSYKIYNNEQVSWFGCGPTCVSMVLNFFEGVTTHTPKSLAEYYKSHSLVDSNGNASFMSNKGLKRDGGKTIIQQFHPDWVVETTSSHSVALQALKDKAIVMALVGPQEIPELPGSHYNHWVNIDDGEAAGQYGHYILIIGYDKNTNKVAVHNPGSGALDSYWYIDRGQGRQPGSGKSVELDFDSYIKAGIYNLESVSNTYTIFRLPGYEDPTDTGSPFKETRYRDKHGIPVVPYICQDNDYVEGGV